MEQGIMEWNIKDIASDTRGYRTLEALDANFIKLNIGELKGILNPLPPDKVEFYMSEHKKKIIAGFRDSGGFGMIAQMLFLRRECFDHLYRNERKVIEGRFVQVIGGFPFDILNHPLDLQRKHIAMAMYLYLIYHGYAIVSGSVQVPFLWESLSTHYKDVTTDILDTKTGEIIKYNYKISGKDELLWDENKNIENIIPIARLMKRG